MIRPGTIGLLALAGALLCGCASSHTDGPPSLISDAPTPIETGSIGYRLSTEELAYDCKKLSGVMQVRILQMRGYDTREKTTAASRTLQSITTPIFGGSKQGTDPDGQYRSDYEMLQAYNARLAEKKCKTYDIDAELKKTDPTETPRPVASP